MKHNSLKFINRLVISLTFLFSVGAISSKAVMADEVRVFVDPANYYEMVRAEVVSVSEDGSGILSVSMHDCDGCKQEFSFSAETSLETPLGDYRGLAKLVDWDDRDVLVVVGKEDGIVRHVKVN